MLREEQIDIRRQRAAEEQFRIQNLGRNRVFSDYQVTNPTTGGQYRVSIRGFDVGDNTCECPDFRTNTLGTCKHIEAVLAVAARGDAAAAAPPQGRRHAPGDLPPLRRATAPRPASAAAPLRPAAARWPRPSSTAAACGRAATAIRSSSSWSSRCRSR